MSRKLVIDNNNVVINIILDANNEVTTIHDGTLLEYTDEDVGIGDTVNDDGTLRSRRLDFVVPTDEERAEEERLRQESIINELRDKV